MAERIRATLIAKVTLCYAPGWAPQTSQIAPATAPCRAKLIGALDGAPKRTKLCREDWRIVGYPVRVVEIATLQTCQLAAAHRKLQAT